jgi:hypothetical protein
MGLLFFQLWRRGDFELGIDTFHREAMRMMLFVRGGGDKIRVTDTHLNDGDLFKGFLWLFLKVIMECNWLGCEDVDECLDKLVLCLTRHMNSLMISSPGPGRSPTFLLSHGCECTLNFHLQ